MFSKFFINRPIFAAVVSIVIIVVGLVALRSLPVARYPEIAPPSIRVTATYPGAGAAVLADTVAQPIEERINGVEGMLYISSSSTNDGVYRLTITFEVGTDLNTAQILVQNRIAQAESSLPEEVQRLGITVEKRSPSILLFATLSSKDNRYNSLFMANYATLNIRDTLTRINGVGSVNIFGSSDYAMRIWLFPDKLKARGLTTSDVISAIREQNVQVAAGQIGQSPSEEKQPFQYTVNVQGRLADAGAFDDIVLRTLPDGGIVRVKDVARVSLGAKDYLTGCQADGKDAAAMAVYLQPGANALSVAKLVKARMKELSETFPEGLTYGIANDTTTFVQASIDEVTQTLFIAAILVILVILVFLQNLRATLIPVVTIPVSLIGTFAVMAALGVSINMLSLFGIVLAIGIVVDDAIVVVENVMRNIDKSGLSAKAATIKAMEEVTGPIVATTLVLLAVFVPTAFLGGITGQLYRQFGLTIATATVFSALNALTLSPALSALLLRPTPARQNIFARAFNRVFDRIQAVYGSIISRLIRRGVVMAFLFLALCGGIYWGFIRQPSGFIPNEDQGMALIAVQLPDAASLSRTLAVVEKINHRMAVIPGIKTWISVPGYSIMDGANASNVASVWPNFDPWEERLPKGLTLSKMIGQMRAALADIQEARIMVLPPPPIRGLGTSGGFMMQLQDRGNLGLVALQAEAQKMMAGAAQDGGLQQVYTSFRASTPQLTADVDRTKTKTLGVPLSDVFDTLQANLGSVYVNDFNHFGRAFQVRVQADEPFRNDPEDIRRLEVRNNRGDMVPLGTVVAVSHTFGPQIINRYNMYPSARLNGHGAQGVSSGDAMARMEALADKTLSQGMGFEWTGMSFQEKAAQGQTFMIFVLAIIFIYLVLCAQYESWGLPLAVILAVPPAVLGTVVAVAVRGTEINVYTQIGIVLLIALTCKTAILIAEFAKASRENGQSVTKAAHTAATLRFRPILMTAATFILGVFPLVIATGPGAAGRQALGTAVFSGMISATLLLVIFVPVFFVLIQRAGERIQARRKKTGPAVTTSGHGQKIPDALKL